jgi:serine/threonine protein kinase
LARGGMGIVYLANDESQQSKPIALKEMAVNGMQPEEQQEAIESFRREAELLHLLDHPNLVKVYDNFSFSQKEYLVMEYIDGDTLDILAGSDTMDEATVLQIAFQLCDALEYLHTRTPAIIYRDLKPNNAMLESESGTLKLIDFGIARRYRPGKSKDTGILGTPGFAPPEQYGNGQTDPRTDIFAFGVTLLVLLTRFDAEQSPWNYPPASTLNPKVSKRLEQLIIKATELDMGKRYQSVADLRNALLHCKGAKKIAARRPAPKTHPSLHQSPPALQPFASRATAPAAVATPASVSVIPANATPVPLPAIPASPIPPPRPPVVIVDAPSLNWQIKEGQRAAARLQFTSSVPVDIAVAAKPEWLVILPERMRAASGEFHLQTATSEAALPQIHRRVPDLIARAWRWAERRGAHRKPWRTRRAVAITLVAGIPALLAGAAAQFVVWLAYQHAYWFVPGAAVLTGAVEMQHPGGAHTLPVRLEITPSGLRTVAGWAGAALSVALEFAALISFLVLL